MRHVTKWHVCKWTPFLSSFTTYTFLLLSATYLSSFTCNLPFFVYLQPIFLNLSATYFSSIICTIFLVNYLYLAFFSTFCYYLHLYFLSPFWNYLNLSFQLSWTVAPGSSSITCISPRLLLDFCHAFFLFFLQRSLRSLLPHLMITKMIKCCRHKSLCRINQISYEHKHGHGDRSSPIQRRAFSVGLVPSPAILLNTKDPWVTC